MKTNFLCMISIVALLLSCNKEDSQTNGLSDSSNSTKITNNAIMSKEEGALDAPFKSFSYVKIDSDTYKFNYEVPENYISKLSIENNAYFVDLTSNLPKDSTVFTNHVISLDGINGTISLTFRVNGVITKRPGVTFEF